MIDLLKIGVAGYCTASAHHAQKGLNRKTIRFNALFALIKHQTKGYILFDTGYTDRFFEGTKKFPYQIYAQATKVYLNKEEEVHAQLKALNISADEIKYIIISHFHADHIGGLKDFPKAQFVCTTKAYKDVVGKSGFSGLMRAFIPSLMPMDFEDRCTFIDVVDGTIIDKDLGTLYDIFDDGSILLCALDGHAEGMIGALINEETQTTFLVSDAAWLKANYQELKYPHPIVKLFFSSWTDYKESLDRVHNYHKNNPKTLIVPTHCQETYNELPTKMILS